MDLEYKVIADNLDIDVMYEIINTIENSEEFEIADESVTGLLSHIVVKNTDTIVGYIGDDSYKLVNNNNLNLYKEHNNLLKIYKHALRCIDSSSN